MYNKDWTVHQANFVNILQITKNEKSVYVYERQGNETFKKFKITL